jgi:hypothetical protein
MMVRGVRSVRRLLVTRFPLFEPASLQRIGGPGGLRLSKSSESQLSVCLYVLPHVIVVRHEMHSLTFLCRQFCTHHAFSSR